MEATFFANQKLFRKWLEKNHKKKPELLVGFYKVGSGKASLTWPQSVDEALCFGWIDGVRKSIDEESYCIRFTPRRSSSIWSAVNIKKIQELILAGLMTAEGEKAFALRTENRSKIYAYEKEPAVLLPEYESAFKKNKQAWSFFMKQAPSYKNVMIHWIMNAKQQATKIARLTKTINESEHQRRLR